ncbi:MAG: GNAT family N-acetyltransferase [Rhizobacter sp.]|nr:GNAT family N-acetyltransferase [Rhizobacter sp.]
MRISLETPNQPEVLQLIEELDAFQKPLYPAESHHGIDIAALSAPHVLFAVARDAQGHAAACGAIVLEATCGEIKRMYTRPANRGQGLARDLLGFLEGEAKQRGCSLFALETGYLQPEAISLYERCGYERCGPFGGYAQDPNSVFMRKNAG